MIDQTLSLYLPRVFGPNDDEIKREISEQMAAQGLGVTSRIDVDVRRDGAKQAFVHFSEWLETQSNEELQQKIRSDGPAPRMSNGKIGYWLLLENTSAEKDAPAPISPDEADCEAMMEAEEKTFDDSGWGSVPPELASMMREKDDTIMLQSKQIRDLQEQLGGLQEKLDWWRDGKQSWRSRAKAMEREKDDTITLQSKQTRDLREQLGYLQEKLGLEEADGREQAKVIRELEAQAKAMVRAGSAREKELVEARCRAEEKASRLADDVVRLGDEVEDLRARLQEAASRERNRGVSRSAAVYTNPNVEMAKLFRELSSLEEYGIKQEAYAKVADRLESLDRHVKSGAEALRLRDIGKSSAAKIQEWLDTGRIAYLEQLREKAPNTQAPDASSSSSAGATVPRDQMLAMTFQANAKLKRENVKLEQALGHARAQCDHDRRERDTAQRQLRDLQEETEELRGTVGRFEAEACAALESLEKTQDELAQVRALVAIPPRPHLKRHCNDPAYASSGSYEQTREQWEREGLEGAVDAAPSTEAFRSSEFVERAAARLGSKGAPVYESDVTHERIAAQSAAFEASRWMGPRQNSMLVDPRGGEVAVESDGDAVMDNA